MKSLFFPLSLLRCVAAVSNGFIYPPSSNSNSQNLTVHEGDSIVLAYTVDVTVQYVGVAIVCEDPINTGIVPAGEETLWFDTTAEVDDTGLALFLFDSDLREGNNTHFWGDVCYLALYNATIASCNDDVFGSRPLLPDEPEPIPTGSSQVFFSSNVTFDNSTWITILKNNNELANATTFTPPASLTSDIKASITAEPSFPNFGTITGCATTPITLTEPTLTFYSSQLPEDTAATAPAKTGSSASPSSSGSTGSSAGLRSVELGSQRAMLAWVLGIGFVYNFV